jgi:hypothetical protein
VRVPARYSTAATLQAAWDAEVSELGPVTSIGAPSSRQADAGVVTVSAPVRFERGELTLTAPVAAAGELAGLQLTPADAARPQHAGAVPHASRPDRGFWFHGDAAGRPCPPSF